VAGVERAHRRHQRDTATRLAGGGDVRTDRCDRSQRPHRAAPASDRVAAASASNSATGQYDVVFERAVNGCAYTATIGDAGAGVPPSGLAGVSQLPGNANGVRVVTRDDAGASANRPFHLTVAC